MPTSPAEAARPEPLLEIVLLTAGYGAAAVVSEVSLRVGRGEVASVLGPNGAGKSTLLKAVVGVLTPMGGHVRLGGRDITGLPANQLAAAGLGYVPQVDDVFPTLTVAENLEMGGYMLRAEDLRRRSAEVLELFPALKRLLARTASQLSGGERKMLAVARALVPSPIALILDEPTSNLASELSGSVLEDVRRLADAGTAVLMVEQKAIAALPVSNWAYVLAGGRLQISDSAATMLQRQDLGEVFLGRKPVEMPT